VTPVGRFGSRYILEDRIIEKAKKCAAVVGRNPLWLGAVWADIAYTFREPVTRDDDYADYAPTQVIAELFRAEGFDGLAYRSGFGLDRFNVALFDVEAAKRKSKSRRQPLNYDKEKLQERAAIPTCDRGIEISID
jgi:hypothetical protein